MLWVMVLTLRNVGYEIDGRFMVISDVAYSTKRNNQESIYT